MGGVKYQVWSKATKVFSEDEKGFRCLCVKTCINRHL
jgi:hypothetical protein